MNTPCKQVYLLNRDPDKDPYRNPDCNPDSFAPCIIYTYTVSRVTYTDEYHACIWTSLGKFRYERYESAYVTLLTV